MPSAFVPFLKNGGKASAAAARVAPADSAPTSGAFAAIVPSPTVSTPSGASATACAHAAAGTPGQPVVTLKKDGDRVTHIHIQCACGQVVELECVF